MRRCAFIKPGGERCKATAMRGYDHCYGHRPDLAEERQRNAAKGGRSGGRGRGSGEIVEIKALLSELTDRVLGVEGKEPLGTTAAAVANQLINTRLRAISLERQILEQEEVIERLERLEQATEGQKGARWGAR
jgi:hypothetical protein